MHSSYAATICMFLKDCFYAILACVEILFIFLINEFTHQILPPSMFYLYDFLYFTNSLLCDETSCHKRVLFSYSNNL